MWYSLRREFIDSLVERRELYGPNKWPAKVNSHADLSRGKRESLSVSRD